MSLVDYSVEGSVAVITMRREPVNALNRELIGEIDDAVARAKDAAIRAVVISGDPHFAAGADISEFKDAYDRGWEDTLAAELGGFVRRFERLDKPTIAAVRGFALGGGLELAMGADFRYLADTAKVGQPEILLGIIPGAGGTQRLPRLVGFQRAREMNFSGRQVGAEEALAVGLADRVVPEPELMEVALAEAARYAEGPTLAYAAVKRAMIDGAGRAIDTGLEIEATAFREAFATHDAQEGVAAFIEKRTPRFRGQ